PIDYQYHRRNLNNLLFDYRTKSRCPASLAFDGQHLILYRCNRIFLIGSGYNDTTMGVEIFSASIDIANLRERFQIKQNRCCLGGWIGFVNGELLLQPSCDWSWNHLIHLDHRSLKVKNIIPLPM